MSDQNDSYEKNDEKQGVADTIRLTDAEREAIECFATVQWTSLRWSKVEKNAATLAALLERLA
jgi:hypothetical protein